MAYTCLGGVVYGMSSGQVYGMSSDQVCGMSSDHVSMACLLIGPSGIAVWGYAGKGVQRAFPQTAHTGLQGLVWAPMSLRTMSPMIWHCHLGSSLVAQA